jgi:hypothetical protein
VLEVDDVDSVTFAEDELGHLRVPEAGLVSKMNTRFQHLSHGHAGHRKLLEGLNLHTPHAATQESLTTCRAPSHT